MKSLVQLVNMLASSGKEVASIPENSWSISFSQQIPQAEHHGSPGQEEFAQYYVVELISIPSLPHNVNMANKIRNSGGCYVLS